MTPAERSAWLEKETKRLAGLLNKVEGTYKFAFDAFLRSATSPEAVARLADSLQKGDTEGAIKQVNEAVARFGTVVANTFNSTAADEVKHLYDQIDQIRPSTAIGFDSTNPRAAELARQAQYEFVKNIQDQQRKAIRSALNEGLLEGKGALGMAQKIKDSIGLTETQNQAVSNYRKLLQGQNGGLSEALTRDIRDRRFDRALQSAMRNGKPLTAQQIDTMVDRYRDRYRRYRAEVIARTEAGRVVAEARNEALRQALEQAGFEQDDVERTWSAALDKRTRDTHGAMNGQTVLGQAAFQSPGGSKLRYPHDPNAPASEVINCRCTVVNRILTAEEIDAKKPKASPQVPAVPAKAPSPAAAPKPASTPKAPAGYDLNAVAPEGSPLRPVLQSAPPGVKSPEKLAWSKALWDSFGSGLGIGEELVLPFGGGMKTRLKAFDKYNLVVMPDGTRYELGAGRKKPKAQPAPIGPAQTTRLGQTAYGDVDAPNEVQDIARVDRFIDTYRTRSVDRSTYHNQRKDFDIEVSQAVQTYIGSSYDPINTYLRTGKLPGGTGYLSSEANMLSVIERVDRAIRQSPLPDETFLYRGQAGRFGIPGVGEEFVQRGFSSFSENARTAHGFATGNHGEKYLLRLNLPKGFPAVYAHKAEEEFILQTGTRYKVLKETQQVISDEYGSRTPYTVIDLEVVGE